MLIASLAISIFMLMINLVPALSLLTFLDRIQDMGVRIAGLVIGTIGAVNVAYFSFKLYACLTTLF